MVIIKLFRQAAVNALVRSTCLNLRSRHTFNLSKKYSSDCQISPVVCKLKSRGIVTLKGADVIQFLQGLLTNDITLLQEDRKSLYTMLLNVQGRVQYDVILYNISRSNDEPALLLECDKTLAEGLMSDIRKYKIRKKVTIEPNKELDVYAQLGPLVDSDRAETNVIVQTEDPRVPQFGSRLIVNGDNGDIDCVDENVYHEERVKWGIPEGPVDLPFGNCLPLECNLVYMNGVSFSKGCYLGQELTARTHHTGVIRKRIMPLVFDQVSDEIEAGENIVNEKNKSVGKFRSSVGKYGLGLMRVADIKGKLSVKTKTGESVVVTAVEPDWWPKA